MLSSIPSTVSLGLKTVFVAEFAVFWLVYTFTVDPDPSLA